MSRFADFDLGPEPGWSPADPLSALASRDNFVRTRDPDRIRLEYYRVPGETPMYAKVVFGPGAEGPPNHAHGGALMAVLDEIAGGTAWVNGYRVVLANFQADMRRSVPLEKVVMVTGDIVDVSGRKVTATGVIADLDGTVYVEAKGLFIRLSDDQASRFNLPAPTDGPKS